MAIRSPFDGLRVPRALVCEFFAVFSRLEFALKDLGFVADRRGRAHPDWDRFSREAANWLQVPPDSELRTAIEYLTGQPPQVQTAQLGWRHAALAGSAPVECALHAVTRVRNNLFHGGKHTLHSPDGRDEKLVRFSLQVMCACLEQNEALKITFEQTEF